MIFLSYNRADTDLVAPLNAALAEAGYDVWQDVKQIRGGSEWREQVADAIAEADVLLLCATPRACASDYVRKEVFFAIQRKKPIIPVNLTPSPVELPYCLELELGCLHFLRWPVDGVDAISGAIKGSVKFAAKPVFEDPLQYISKQLLDSDSLALKSLGKDCITFGRLLDVNTDMAAVRAARIVARTIAYLKQLSLSEGNGVGESPDPAIMADAGIVQEIAAKVDVDAMLNISSGPDESDEGDETRVTPEEADVCRTALLRMLGTLIKNARSQAQPAEAGMESLQVISGSQISREQLQQLFLVGQRTFGKEVMPDFSVMEKFHSRNKDIYQALIEQSTGVCVGYTSIIPLDQTSFERTLSHDFADDAFSMDDIQPMDMPGFYYLHLSSIVVDPSYRDLSMAYKMLSTGYSDYLTNLAARDIYIIAVSADAITTSGRRMCDALGLKPMEQRNERSTLYVGSLLPPKMRLSSKQGMLLLQEYKGIYDKFKDMIPAFSGAC